MTKNKARALEALAYIDSFQNQYPPYNAVTVQQILKDDLGYGDFDLANLTRTLKALVDQGLAKSSVGRVDMPGENGCIDRWFVQTRLKYWPADLDLAAMELHYKGTTEEQELKSHNLIGRIFGARAITMEEFRAYKAELAAPDN